MVAVVAYKIMITAKDVRWVLKTWLHGRQSFTDFAPPPPRGGLGESRDWIRILAPRRANCDTSMYIEPFRPFMVTHTHTVYIIYIYITTLSFFFFFFFFHTFLLPFMSSFLSNFVDFLIPIRFVLIPVCFWFRYLLEASAVKSNLHPWRLTAFSETVVSIAGIVSYIAFHYFSFLILPPLLLLAMPLPKLLLISFAISLLYLFLVGLAYLLQCS